jgi:hypothetical protein
MIDDGASRRRSSNTTASDLTGKGAQQITAITVMAGNDVRRVGPSASRFSLKLL